MHGALLTSQPWARQAHSGQVCITLPSHRAGLMCVSFCCATFPTVSARQRLLILDSRPRRQVHLHPTDDCHPRLPYPPTVDPRFLSQQQWIKEKRKTSRRRHPATPALTARSRRPTTRSARPAHLARPPWRAVAERASREPRKSSMAGTQCPCHVSLACRAGERAHSPLSSGVFRF